MESKICTRCQLEKQISDFSHRHENGNCTTKSWCKSCSNQYGRDHAHLIGKNKPMESDRTCPQFLGIHVAERILSHYFEDVKRMPINNPGYDFICKNGYKIDVKSSCKRHGTDRNMPRWMFDVRYNTVADHFLCLAFDDRTSLTPLHVWLIPGNEVNHVKVFAISDSLYGLNKWSRFERPLNKVIGCCNALREH